MARFEDKSYPYHSLELDETESGLIVRTASRFSDVKEPVARLDEGQLVELRNYADKQIERIRRNR